MKTQVVGMGPVTGMAPIKDFTRLSNASIEAAWQLVGPSVRVNMDRCPLWRVIAAAYLEGLNHGSGVSEEINAPAK